MGTNFYARRILTQEEKEKLLKAIERDNRKEIVKIVSELYSIYHLGKRSSGWDFLWNTNAHEEWNGKEYVTITPYPLNKAGISEFCLRKDIIIEDEYGKTISSEDFLKMAFSWKGINNEQYYNDPTKDRPFKAFANIHDERTINMFRRLGFEIAWHEFYNDGLRFSSEIEFS